MTVFRKMTPADYDQIYRLWISTPGMGLNSTDDSKDGIERYLNRNPETCFVAEENGTIIGVIMAGNDGRRGFIHHTAVVKDCRRRGIARSLVEHAMAALEKQGITKTALVVFAENETGNAFWEKLGFSARSDLVYRNKNIRPLTAVPTHE